MDDAEYNDALTFLAQALEALDLSELLRNAVAASADARSPYEQVIRSLQAIRADVAALDRYRVDRVLDGLNEVVATESGQPISEVYLELTEAEARVEQRPRLNLGEEGGDLREVIAALDDLIEEVIQDRRGGRAPN